jgi:UPF0755 protein
MRRALIVLTVLILLVLGTASGLLLWTHRWLDSPVASIDKPTTFEVTQGASLRSIASALAQRQVIDQPRVWEMWGRLTGRAGGLKAGEYQLQPGLTPRTLLELLSSGQVILHSITFIEGSTFTDLRKTLAQHPAVKGEYSGRSPADVMRALGEPDRHPEGQFFPDTYRFARGTTDLELLTLAHRRLKDELAAAWNSRAEDLPLANAYEALILASIVEKETGLDRERPLIAGVFVERLRRGMRLQTDPTVIYGMMQNYDGNIRRTDLLRDTPYNTYTRSGLPPTPIAMPGLESIRAAVRPEVSGAIFFVATGEPDGSHYFSKTLPEHEAAVRRYLQKLRRRS